MEKQEKRITSKLQEGKKRLTGQRLAVIRIFLENLGTHLSAEEIFRQLREKGNQRVGLATVYRTVDLLAEMGVLRRLDFGEGRARYELAGEGIHHHHHLSCRSCGRVFEFGEDLLEGLEKEVQRRTGFLVLDHEVRLLGLCAPCQKKSRKKDTGAGS